MPRIFHPQFEQLLDRKSGLHFNPEKVEGVWRAVAEVPEEQVAEFLDRGFRYVDPPQPEPEPEPVDTTRKRGK